MNLETMSTNVVKTMFELSKNHEIGRLLFYDVPEIGDTAMHPPINSSDLIKTDSTKRRIFPTPFDTEVTDEDGSFIRVYYNDGDFNENGVIAESQIHIDIVCSKGLWLVRKDGKSLIRPYAIAGQVIDTIGQRSFNPQIKLKFTGYQHLYVNTKFDCIRLYAEYMSIET